MRQMIKWIYFQLKVECKRVSLPLLVFFQIMLFLLLSYMQSSQPETCVVLLNPGNSKYAKEICITLEEQNNAFYTFIIEENQERLESTILIGQVGCEFVFADDFDRLILQAKIRNAITYQSLAGYMDGEVVKEMVFAKTYAYLAPQIAIEYVKDQLAEEQIIVFRDAMAFEQNNFTLSLFEIKTWNQENLMEIQSSYTRIQLLLCMLFTMITVLGGIFACVSMVQQKPFYLKFNVKEKYKICIIQCVTPILIITFFNLILLKGTFSIYFLLLFLILSVLNSLITIKILV